MELNSQSSILIIDDSTTNQVLLEAILQEEGYKTETALSAKEAFAIIERRKPKLILLDLLMPQVNGFDVLERLKTNETTTSIPVIVVSAVGTKENIEICKNLGANDFFSKPIDIPVFLKKLKDYIK